MRKAMNDVIVLLPGILGSVLKRNGDDVWGLSGGAIGRALLSFGGTAKALALIDNSADPDVQADGITADRLMNDVHLIPRLWKIDGYTKVTDAIKAEFDVQEGANFFPFPYDWRRDNRVSAKQLAARTKVWLAEWRKRPGKQDTKLILIAHSMGGLVARFFLECLEGWGDTRALITFGTPYRGSVDALDTLANGLKIGFGPLSVDLSGFAQSMPSLHQLLPIYPCYDPGDGTLGRVYEVPGIPRLDPAKAKAANAFHREIEAAVTKHLEDPAYRAGRYAIHAVVGRKQRTLQSGRLAGGGDRVEMLATYKGEDLEGDGTVPRVSATPIELGDAAQGVFAAELHGSLQNADAVLVNLGGILSGFDIHSDAFRAVKPGLGRGVPVRVELDDAYPAQQPIAVTITPEQDFVEMEATLENVDDGTVLQTLTVGQAGDTRRPISFDGLAAGTYRLTVNGADTSPVHDVFVVL